MQAEARTDARTQTRTAGLLGALGGALMIGSYFLPSVAVPVSPTDNPPYHIELSSIWNEVTSTLLGSTPVAPVSGESAQTLLRFTSAAEMLAPMVVGLVILGLGLWALLRRSGRVGPAFRAVAATMAVIAVLAIKGSVSFYGYGRPNTYTAFGGVFALTAPLEYLGPTVFLCGAVLAVVSAFVYWQGDHAPVSSRLAGTAGALGALGGALMIGSYFLPAALSAGAGADPVSTSGAGVLSLWDIITPLLSFSAPPTSALLVNNDPSGYGQLFTVALLVAPLLAAALLLILGVRSWIRRDQPTGTARRAGASVAVVVVVLALTSVIEFAGYAPQVSVTGAAQYTPLLSLGPLVFLAGALLALFALFLDWQREAAPAAAPSARAAGVVGALGGALVIAAYFLPAERVFPNLLGLAPARTQLVSTWSTIIQSLFTAPSVDPQTGAPVGNFQIMATLEALAPLLAAVMLLGLSLWACFRGPGPARRALTTAAAVVVALALCGTVAFYGSNIPNTYTVPGPALQNAPIFGLGPVAFLCGALLALLAVFLGWRSAASEPQAQPQPQTRTAGVFGALVALGGALVIAAYFLPSALNLYANTGGNVISNALVNEPPDNTVLSVWSLFMAALSAAQTTAGKMQLVNSAPDGGLAFGAAVLLFAPLIAAVLLLILGVWMWLQRAKPVGPVQRALVATALVVVGLALASTLQFFGYGLAEPQYTGAAGLTTPLIMLGPVVLLCGGFLALVSALLVWRRGQAEATEVAAAPL